MGQPLRDETYLSRVVRDPSSGRHHHEAGIRCRRCGQEDWATAPNPGWGRRIFRRRGWKCGNGANQHLCPACMGAKRTAREPATVHQLFDLPSPDITAAPTPEPPPLPASPLVEFPDPPEIPTPPAMKEESMAQTALAEALQPLKANLERTQIVKGSRGKPTGYKSFMSAQNSVRIVCRKLGVEHPVREKHYRITEEPDGTWSYLLVGALENKTPAGVGRILRIKEGHRTSTRASAANNAQLACERAGIDSPKEGIHFEVSGSPGEGYIYKILPAAKLDEPPEPDCLGRVCGGGYLSRFDARKHALAALQAARKTGGAPVENVDYWVTQDGYNLWGWSTTKPCDLPVVEPPAVEMSDASTQAVRDAEEAAKAPPDDEPRKAEDPRKASPAENRRIMDALDEHYDLTRQRYHASFNDRALAQKLNFPRAWVSRVREEFYGPEACEADDEERRKQRAMVEAAIKAAESALGKSQDVLDTLAELETLIGKLREAQKELGR